LLALLPRKAHFVCLVVSAGDTPKAQGSSMNQKLSLAYFCR
jgi:hypothetical protein